ncbi:MAG: ParB/RepB/Spo0J family partition protein [Bryobacteraceae bacterium]|jgi:ParB family chromosome partitioning protein
MNTIHLIRINAIHILNPRSRKKVLFDSIIANIGTLGLKKPIIVTRQREPLGEKEYDLVCGQGRLEAYQALGHEEIPAIIVEKTRDEAYLMSLVENIARRHHTPLELLKEITTLKGKGLTTEKIATKLGLERTYVYAIMHLLEHGEDVLVKEVERGRIPVSLAVKISTAADHDVQAALREAYASGELRRAQLLATKRFLAQRKRPAEGTNKKRLSAQAAVRAYKQFTVEHKAFVKRARQTEERLLLIVSVIKTLIADEHFVTLLRAENLDTLPSFLLDRLKKG